MKRLHNFTDEELIDGLRSHNGEIINQFYVHYFETVRYLVIRNNGNSDDAKDVFQDSLIVLFQKVRIDGFKLTSSLKTYLYAVAKALWLKELNRRKKYKDNCIDEELIDIASDVWDTYEHNERLFLYRSVFEQMSPKCRLIMSLYNEGRSVKEITKIMGYKSEQYTKNKRYRCKQNLMKRITATYGYHELKYEADEDDREIP